MKFIKAMCAFWLSILLLCEISMAAPDVPTDNSKNSQSKLYLSGAIEIKSPREIVLHLDSPYVATFKALSRNQPDILSSLKSLKDRYNKAKSEEEQRRLAKKMIRLLLTEEKKEKNSRFDAAIRIFNSNDYYRLALTVSRSDSPELLLSLLRMHERKGLSVTFGQAITDPLLTGPDSFFAEAMTVFGADGVFELLAHTTAAQVKRMSQQQATALLARLERFFDPSKIHEEPFSRWMQAYGQLVHLRQIERKLEKIISTKEALVWLEVIHRKFESDLKSNPEASRSFLRELHEQSLDASWLKFRVLGRNETLDSGVQLESITPVYRLDRVLKARLQAHLATTQAELKSFIKSYCEILEYEKISGATVTLAEWETSFEKLTAPGCHHINSDANNGDQPALKTISRSFVQMSFDSVWIVPDVDLSVNTDSYFDGSFIDLSSIRTHPRLVSDQKTPDEFNAIVFPIVAGFKVKGHPRFNDGIYYIIAHDVYREAKSAPAIDGKLIPKSGYRGGNLTISYKDKVMSMAPTFLSIGGKGQEGVEALSGGKGDESRVTRVAVKLYLSRYLAEHPETIAKGESPILLEPMDTNFLADLLKAAEREAPSPEFLGAPPIKLFIPEGYLFNLDLNQGDQLNAQGKKIADVCKNADKLDFHANGSLNLERCFETLIGRDFGIRLGEVVQVFAGSARSREILSFLDIRAYETFSSFSVPGSASSEPGISGVEGNPGVFYDLGDRGEKP